MGKDDVMTERWNPHQPPPRRIPMQQYLGWLWSDFFKIVCLIGVIFLIAYLKSGFDLRNLDKVEWVIVLTMVGLMPPLFMTQAWALYRMMRDGVLVKAELVNLRFADKDEEVMRMTLRWTYAGQEYERKRIYPNSTQWHDFTERVQREGELWVIIDPKKPRRGGPLEMLMDRKATPWKYLLTGK